MLRRWYGYAREKPEMMPFSGIKHGLPVMVISGSEEVSVQTCGQNGLQRKLPAPLACKVEKGTISELFIHFFLNHGISMGTSRMYCS